MSARAQFSSGYGRPTVSTVFNCNGERGWVVRRWTDMNSREFHPSTPPRGDVSVSNHTIRFTLLALSPLFPQGAGARPFSRFVVAARIR
jgi:hypothetical protein